MRIGSGVYLVGGHTYRLTQGSNVYLLEGADGLTLIDVGAPGDGARLCANVEALGFAREQVRTILLTHAHQDHVGAVAEALAYFPATVLASPYAAEALHCGDGRTAMRTPEQRTTPVAAVRHVAPGDRLPWCHGTIEVLATPGHTPGCQSFLFSLDGRTALAAGDALMPAYLKRMCWTGGIDFDAQVYVETLFGLLRACPAEVLLPAHGPPALRDAWADVWSNFQLAREEAERRGHRCRVVGKELTWLTG